MSRGLIIALLIGGIAAIAAGLYFMWTPDTEPTPVQNGDTGQPTAPEVTYSSPGVADMISVEAPAPGARVSLPVTVTGQARGSWYFEGQASAEIQNADGEVVADGAITADGEWMTEEFVPFSGTLERTGDAAATEAATLIIRNANPSGLPQNSETVSIPVTIE